MNYYFLKHYFSKFYIHKYSNEINVRLGKWELIILWGNRGGYA